MPDWIIHMGATHVLSRPLGVRDGGWLLLGAVIPDAVPRITTGLMMAIPPIRPLATGHMQLYLSFLHTPFSVVLLVGALVVWARERGAAAFALTFGAVCHFALDVLQKTYGGGSSLLYPVELAGFSLQVAWYENPVTYGLVAVFAGYLAWLVLRRRDYRELLRRPSRRAAIGSALLLGVCFATPAFVVDAAIRQNVAASRLASVPSEFEGQIVDLPVASVREVDAQDVELEVMAELFLVARGWLPEVGVGDHVSVRGTYRSGRIEPEDVFVHNYAFKSAVSILATLVLFIVWAPVLWRVVRRRGC